MGKDDAAMAKLCPSGFNMEAKMQECMQGVDQTAMASATECDDAWKAQMTTMFNCFAGGCPLMGEMMGGMIEGNCACQPHSESECSEDVKCDCNSGDGGKCESDQSHAMMANVPSTCPMKKFLLKEKTCTESTTETTCNAADDCEWHADSPECDDAGTLSTYNKCEPSAAAIFGTFAQSVDSDEGKQMRVVAQGTYAASECKAKTTESACTGAKTLAYAYESTENEGSATIDGSIKPSVGMPLAFLAFLAVVVT